MTDRPGEMDERDVDERFASIVAAWDGPLPSADDPPTDLPESGPDAGGPPGEDLAAPDPAAADATPTDPAPEGAARPERPPWVNPMPLDLVVPASTWRTPTTSTGSTGAGRTAPPADEDDEHFEPPPVTLPPQEDLHFWGAVVGLVVGPLLLLYVALARPVHTDRWFAAGVLLSLVGFGLLVLRQPRHRDPTDGDDGARV